MDINFAEFIKPELLILVAALYFVGMGIKKSAYIADKNIPLSLAAVGVLLAIIYVLATSVFAGWQSVLMAVFVAITQGIMCAGCSVFVNQIIKQSAKKE